MVDGLHGSEDQGTRTEELTASLNETIEKQHEVFTCEAECAGVPALAMPAPGCAEPFCIQATACEVEVAGEMDIPVTAPGITENLMYYVDKCAYERPLSGEDIACFREKPCSTLATSVRSMRPGECSEG